MLYALFPCGRKVKKNIIKRKKGDCRTKWYQFDLNNSKFWLSKKEVAPVYTLKKHTQIQHFVMSHRKYLIKVQVMLLEKHFALYL